MGHDVSLKKDLEGPWEGLDLLRLVFELECTESDEELYELVPVEGSVWVLVHVFHFIIGGYEKTVDDWHCAVSIDDLDLLNVLCKCVLANTGEIIAWTKCYKNVFQRWKILPDDFLTILDILFIFANSWNFPVREIELQTFFIYCLIVFDPTFEDTLLFYEQAFKLIGFRLKVNVIYLLFLWL